MLLAEQYTGFRFHLRTRVPQYRATVEFSELGLLNTRVASLEFVYDCTCRYTFVSIRSYIARADPWTRIPEREISRDSTPRTSRRVTQLSRASNLGEAPVPLFRPAAEETPAGLGNFFSSAFYGYTGALIMHMLNIKRGPRVSV